MTTMTEAQQLHRDALGYAPLDHVPNRAAPEVVGHATRNASRATRDLPRTTEVADRG